MEGGQSGDELMPDMSGAESGGKDECEFPGFKIRSLPWTAAAGLKFEEKMSVDEADSVSPTSSSHDLVQTLVHLSPRSPSEEAVSSVVTNASGLDDGVCSYVVGQTKHLTGQVLHHVSGAAKHPLSPAQLLCSERSRICAVEPSSSLCSYQMRPQLMSKQTTNFGADTCTLKLKAKRKSVAFYDRSNSKKLPLGSQDCDCSSLLKSNTGSSRNQRNKRVKCPITEKLIQNNILKLGDRVEYRPDKNKCYAQGWIRASGIVCGKCGQHVTCSDFGCCAGKHRGEAGEHIYFPCGKTLAEHEQFLTHKGTLSVQLTPSDSAKDVQQTTDEYQGIHLDYDKTIDLLFGHN